MNRKLIILHTSFFGLEVSNACDTVTAFVHSVPLWPSANRFSSLAWNHNVYICGTVTLSQLCLAF